MNRDFEKEIEEACRVKIKEVASWGAHAIGCRVLNEFNDFKTVKVIPNKVFFRSENLKAAVLHELSIAKTLQNSNSFIRLEGHVYTQNYLVLIYEDHFGFGLENLYKDIDLSQYIAVVFKDLTDAIVVLRDNKLIHHEISLRHVFLLNGYVKLGGLDHIFPVATPLPSFFAYSPRHLEYLPPEHYTKKNLLFSSQVFSLGVLIFWLLFEAFPYPAEVRTPTHFRDYFERKKIMDLETNAVCPEPNVFAIVRECLRVEYSDRITIRYLKTTLDQYLKDRGSMLHMRKNAISKNKENLKKAFEGKGAKDSSFNSFRKCEFSSHDEDRRRRPPGTQGLHQDPVPVSCPI